MNAFTRMNSYGSFRSAPMTDEEIARRAPSVFATEPHESRSARYAYIPTSAVLAGLRAEGFEPYSAAQGRSRIAGKAEYTKHVLRLRHRSFDASRAIVGDTVPEIVLLNSHDGTSSYQLMSGAFRIVCLNGLITGDSYETVKVGHTGKAVEKVIEGAYRVLGETDRVTDAIETWAGTALAPDEQIAFSRAALQLRYRDEDDAGFSAPALAAPKRREDRGDDLWRTFNRIQEGLIRGGQQRRNRVAEDGRRIRDAAARQVTGIDETKAINRALWTLAEEMRRIKAGDGPAARAA